MSSKWSVQPIVVCWKGMCVAQIDRVSFQRMSYKRSAFVRKTSPMYQRRTNKIQFIKEIPSSICIQLISKHFHRRRLRAMVIMAMVFSNMNSMNCNSNRYHINSIAVRQLHGKRKCKFYCLLTNPLPLIWAG